MRFELFVASRYLRAKRRQAVVGVITAISVIGVAAGVASLILALAITNGMQRDLQKGLLSSTAQVQLMRTASDGIEIGDSLTDRLRTLPHVTAAAPALYGQVLISRGARSGGARSKAFCPRKTYCQQPARQTSSRGRGTARPRPPNQVTAGFSSRRWSSAPTLPIRSAQASATAYGHQPAGRVDALRPGAKV